MFLKRGILSLTMFLAFVACALTFHTQSLYAKGNVHLIIIVSTTDASIAPAQNAWQERLEGVLAGKECQGYPGSDNRLGPAVNLGGLGPNDVATYKVLTGSDAHPDKILETCREVTRKAGPDDAIMAFVFSHGGIMKGKDGVTRHFFSPLATVDDDLEYARTGIKRGSIMRALKENDHRLIALVSDSCATPTEYYEDIKWRNLFKTQKMQSWLLPKDDGYLKRFLLEASGEIDVNSADFGQSSYLEQTAGHELFWGTHFINAFVRFASNGFYLESELNADDFYKLLSIELQRELVVFNERYMKTHRQTLTSFKSDSQRIEPAPNEFDNSEKLSEYDSARFEKMKSSQEFNIGNRVIKTFRMVP